MNDFAATLSATPSSLGVVPRGNRRHTMADDDTDNNEPDAPQDTDADLDALQFEMLSAWDDYKGAATTALEAGVIIGRAAAKAKKAHGHGNFGEWIDKHLPFGQVWARTCVRAAVAYDLLAGAPKGHALAADFAAADTIEKLAALANPAQGKLPAKRRLDLSQRPGADTDVTDVVAKGEEGAPMDPAQRLRVWEESLDAREAALRVSLAALKRREWAVAARERAAGIDPEAAAAQALADAEGSEAPEVLTPEAALIATAAPAQVIAIAKPDGTKPLKRPSRAKAKAPEAPKEAATHGAGSIDEGRAMIAKADAQRAAKAAKVATPAKAPSKPGPQRQQRAKPKGEGTPAPMAENGSENDDTPM